MHAETSEDTTRYGSRAGGLGSLLSMVSGVDDTTASIYRIEKDGSLVHEDVPIDDRDRLSVNGRKYGRDYWRH